MLSRFLHFAFPLMQQTLIVQDYGLRLCINGYPLGQFYDTRLAPTHLEAKSSQNWQPNTSAYRDLDSFYKRDWADCIGEAFR